jgi:hypothetical protein
MTLATLLKAALVAYGLMLGGAFLFLRLYPELASRTVFEWGREAASIAGTLVPTEGVDRPWLANVPVELLGSGFGDRLARIAGEARREIEAMARAAAEEARQEALAVAETELAAAERRLLKADEALVAASAALAPSAPPPGALEPAPVYDPERDPDVISAVARVESARAAEEETRQALQARAESFLVERRREQARHQLRVASRRLTEAEGGGIELTVENGGPLAVTRIVLALASAGQPVATYGGRAVLASEGTPLGFAPEIVNEYEEKITGLPPKLEWRLLLPLDRALEGRPGAFTVEVLDAEFADAGSLERASPYGAGTRVWAYPQVSQAELFAADLSAAAPRFVETLAMTQAERRAATAEADLLQARARAEERARLVLLAERAARQPPAQPDASADAEEAAAQLREAQAARDRWAGERDEIQARIGRIREGTETALLSDRVNDGRWEEALDRVKRAIAAKLSEARLDERRDTARTDESGAFRFTGLPAGTYYLYSPLTDPSGAVLHYVQRLRFMEDGGIVFEPPLAMSQEQFLHGALEAGM